MTEPMPEPDIIKSGPFSNVRVLELADEKGQFCAKLMADLGADVIKIEPPGGSSYRHTGPFANDVKDPNSSLPFWYYNTSKRGVTLDIEHPDGVELFSRLAQSADVIIETFAPGYMAGIHLGYETLARDNPGLIMCSITSFGQTGPWAHYQGSDLLHMAAGGQMASCGYDPEDDARQMPIAPGGGNAWHMAGHYAYMAIVAALVYRTMSGEGQYIDASVHDACALTTEAAVPTYIYRGETLHRQTGRHHGIARSPRTQFESADGGYVTALIANQLSPKYVKNLRAMLVEYGMAGDLFDDRYDDAEYVQSRALHIVETLVANFIASVPAEEAYHAAQERGFTWGAVRPAEALFDDEHLDDREFWKDVEHPELGRSYTA